MAVAIKQFCSPTLQNPLHYFGNYCGLGRFINDNQYDNFCDFDLFRLVVENIALQQRISHYEAPGLRKHQKVLR